MPAEENRFKVGEKVVYPAQGVAEVVALETKNIAGQDILYYVIRVLDTDRKILVPVANATAVGLRCPMSEEEITEIFRILGENPGRVPDLAGWNRRYRGFMDKIKTGSIYDVAEVARDLICFQLAEKALSFGERRMLDTALSLLSAEISIARSQSRELIKEQLRTAVRLT